MPSEPHKTVVITGASKGFGSALARECARRGYALALIDIDPAGLSALQTALSDIARVSIHTADVSLEADIVAARQSIIGQHSRIDLLINNAGVSVSRPFEQTDAEDFRRLMEVNFWGAVHCARHFLPDLRASSGRMANVISGFALMGFPGKSAYAASKGAIMSFTNVLRTELAGSGVSISLVVPPPMDTDIIWAGGHVNEEKRAAEAAFIRRTGMPADRAAATAISGIQRGKYRIVIGWRTWLQDLAARLFPTRVHRLIGKQKDRFDFI